MGGISNKNNRRGGGNNNNPRGGGKRKKPVQTGSQIPNKFDKKINRSKVNDLMLQLVTDEAEEVALKECSTEWNNLKLTPKLESLLATQSSLQLKLEEQASSSTKKVKSAAIPAAQDTAVGEEKQQEQESQIGHWGYLLQEMQWMAADFTQETNWKRLRSKKILRSVLAYHKKKANKAVQDAKALEATRRRVASKIGRDVKKFWGKIDKIVAYKLKLEDDAAKKSVMDKHLRFLIGQTEKYATAMISSFENTRDTGNTAAGSITSPIKDTSTTTITSSIKDCTSTTNPIKDSMSISEDEEFEADMEEEDDERTLEEAEAFDTARQNSCELNDLKAENEMSIEELRAKYKLMEEDEEDEEEEELEFCPSSPGIDDETSIAEQERIDAQEKEGDELDMLKQEGEMSIEELRALYSTTSSVDESSMDVVEEKSNTSSTLSTLYNDSEEEEEEYILDDVEEDDESTIIEAEESARRRKGRDAPFEELELLKNDAAQSLDQVLESSRNITSTSIVPRPFLLSPKLVLREYQQAGLDWLASMTERRMNGILADEMGLGKTIQTISLLAHLASEKGIWGPHLIVVPTSCLVNWEMEFKRWCPSFKVLSYYGSSKRRKDLRSGWSRLNSFQVCITSYQLVVQDAHCFRRKKWYFLILDEAHNIKNWKSLRWQTLLTFNSHRRLLLTGTPLQNNLMELWALMHFLMPHVFRSRKEFSYWFSTPLNSLVESNNNSDNDDLVSRLHGVIRPFVLRRLKKDVEKQLPGKYEHVIMCTLSKRQRYLYEDFMSRSSTRSALGGNFLGMLNVLMKLRKVCNHPDLFEARPIVSSFDLSPIEYLYPKSMMILQNDSTSFIKLRSCSLGTIDRQEICKLAVPAADIISHASEFTKRIKSNSSITQEFVNAVNEERERQKKEKLSHVAYINNIRCNSNAFNSIDDVITLLQYVGEREAMKVHRTRGLQTSNALSQMIKCPTERVSTLLMPTLEACMCVVPRARVVNKSSSSNNSLIREIKTRVFNPAQKVVYDAYKRTQLFFPDKRLIQFDCGKLQALDSLLREKKNGNHRCLIFTQMSSMLDILESFLSLHGHTYFRLDGSTRVEKRQYLMDRFNADEKVFCFILSTRSGGLGINLTGADTVIFYDSDWNPAMDAQAQDRAHRIGQTRDVHIYRLVSEQTIEENILKKASQKKHLDFLVMGKGNFTTEHFYSKAGLLDIVTGDNDNGNMMIEEDSNAVNVEEAMLQVEDEEDVAAMRGAKEEMLNEQREFDDSIKTLSPVEQQEGEDVFSDDTHEVVSEGEDFSDLSSISSSPEKRKRSSKKKITRSKRIRAANDSAIKEQRRKEKLREKELELEQERQLQLWKESVSLARFEDGLRTIDKFALHFRQQIDPPWGWVKVPVPLLPDAVESSSPPEEELEIERIEAQKIVEEQSQMENGELIAATGPKEGDTMMMADLYRKERRVFQRELKQRQMTGDAWVTRQDAKYNCKFYYNIDTREAVWEAPVIVKKNLELKSARSAGYTGLSDIILFQIAAYLVPFPDRIGAMSFVCKSWSKAATSDGHWHVIKCTEEEDNDIGESVSLSDSINNLNLLRGDTIFLAKGIHLLKSKLVLKVAGIRFIGDRPVKNYHHGGGFNTEIRVSSDNLGQVVWEGLTTAGGLFQFISIKRETALTTVQSHVLPLVLVSSGNLVISDCKFHGGHAGGACIEVSGPNSYSTIVSSTIDKAGTSGVLCSAHGRVLLLSNAFRWNKTAGITLLSGSAAVRKNLVTRNHGVGIQIFEQVRAIVDKNDFRYNTGGPVLLEDEKSCLIKMRRNDIVDKKNEENDNHKK